MVIQRLLYSASLAVVIFLGCDPYRFKVETRYPVDCRIFSDHNSVDSHLYGFEMHPESVLQVTSLAWTQYDLKAYFTLSGGEGFQLMLRPVVEESVIDSGFVLTFSSAGGMRLDSAGHLIEVNTSFRFPKDSLTYVTIYNEESYLQVTVGCDTVVKRFTMRKSSDDIVLKTFSGSELKVVDPQWKQIRFLKNNEVKEEE